MAHILIADDAPDLRNFAVLSLKLEGHHVVSANDGQQAVDCYKEALDARCRFDLVILDVAMPEINGLEAAERIRELWPGQRIAFLTAMDDPLTYSRAVVDGANAFWSKPLDAPTLRSNVASVL